MTTKRLYELALQRTLEIWSAIHAKRIQVNPGNALLLEREQKAWQEYMEVQDMLCALEKNLMEE